MSFWFHFLPYMVKERSWRQKDKTTSRRFERGGGRCSPLLCSSLSFHIKDELMQEEQVAARSVCDRETHTHTHTLCSCFGLMQLHEVLPDNKFTCVQEAHTHLQTVKRLLCVCAPLKKGKFVLNFKDCSAVFALPVCFFIEPTSFSCLVLLSFDV